MLVKVVNDTFLCFCFLLGGGAEGVLLGLKSAAIMLFTTTYSNGVSLSHNKRQLKKSKTMSRVGIQNYNSQYMRLKLV